MTSAEGCPGSRGLMQPRRPGEQRSLFAAGGQSPCCTEFRQGSYGRNTRPICREVVLRKVCDLPHKTFTTANTRINDLLNWKDFCDVIHIVISTM